VDLEVKEGEIFGLLGPNGAGKTTLISILCGILSPDKGDAEILGMDCTRQTKQVQTKINIVSGFSGVIFSLSVEEALMYYCLLYNVQEPKKKIETVMKQVGLEDAKGLVAQDLSSGMRQRYLIAKGLLNDPKVLILDEPTVGLDVESAINIRNVVKRLRKEGRTILLTTHNMFEAEELCDRIAFINHGRVTDTGTPEELKARVVSKRTIEVHCSRESCIITALSPIKGVEAHLRSANLVHVSVDSYKRMKEILKVISGCDSEIYGINELEPTLEETYLKLINGPGKEGGEGKKAEGGGKDA
ncbi:MAG: ABC transporter ATP-binding protein, partial [Candidatus Micrarchaeota archaeon]